MEVIIEDNGTKIKITSGLEVKNVIKSQIREIEVIKTNIIKIDIGRDALENVFINFPDVTSPLKPSPESLRDLLLSFLESAGGSDAKESRQLEQTEVLNALKATSLSLQVLVGNIDNKTMFQPLIIDRSGANVVYKGYAPVGTATDSALWAIEKVSSLKNVETHLWADGDMKFDNVWNNRETLIYK